MRNTYTSKLASKRSTHIINWIFWNIFICNKQNTLRCRNQRVQCKTIHVTKLSHTKTYDEEHDSTNTLPIAPHLPNLPQNHPLSLVSRNFRNLAIKNPPNLRPNTIKSSI